MQYNYPLTFVVETDRIMLIDKRKNMLNKSALLEITLPLIQTPSLQNDAVP